ncbi:unnamed protein product, partial [Nesidiocoris tenuis]
QSRLWQKTHAQPEKVHGGKLVLRRNSICRTAAVASPLRKVGALTSTAQGFSLGLVTHHMEPECQTSRPIVQLSAARSTYCTALCPPGGPLVKRWNQTSGTQLRASRLDPPADGSSRRSTRIPLSNVLNRTWPPTMSLSAPSTTPTFRLLNRAVQLFLPSRNLARQLSERRIRPQGAFEAESRPKWIFHTAKARELLRLLRMCKADESAEYPSMGSGRFGKMSLVAGQVSKTGTGRKTGAIHSRSVQKINTAIGQEAYSLANCLHGMLPNLHYGKFRDKSSIMLVTRSLVRTERITDIS